ncbi:LptF/LptG family permease [Xanthomarina sp. F2636L]|uniref:LptF/LptG family permease n=1 Tax=Xanthomarina sp. F2636L TaxID=2996018 RepID=UPI00225E42DB|nr:LptF/LptG family permease [Xanthomarina sp. F2636L]MCX7549858.1 LptF/LptG family permease [Xanthomarina sp. F2636L]
MKILDKYILTSYLKTFISVFVILMLIFVLQTIWLYIKELAGKDLDMVVVAKFLLYFAPKLIPLVLPLTILLASIMVFGNFAENYEFAAMKSTGISLQRAMKGLSVFIVALGITTFFFTNNVIPWAEYNSYNLRKNIAKLKPAMVIAKGQFNEVGNEYNIKVADKSGDRGQFLKEVLIHKKSGVKAGNHTTIYAKTGELIGEAESDILQLMLFDGYFYDDTPPKDHKERLRLPMTKSYFKKYTINVDLSNLNNIDLEQKDISDKYNMLNIRDLSYTIDTLKIDKENTIKELATNLYNRSNLPVINKGVTYKKESNYNGSILELFSNKDKVQLIDIALNTFKSTQQIITVKEQGLKTKAIWLNRHIIALHEKLALGFACVILFFVGAPLGALIRKGGIGLPMVIAILLFLTYHFIGIFAKNSAKDGSLNPVFAAWFSTIIMMPLGAYLTKRATEDRGLFEFDHIIEPIKKLLRIKEKEDPKSTSKLPEAVREVIEEKHGLTKEPLALKEDYDAIIKRHSDYKDYAKFTFIFYIIGAILLPLYFILKNNKLEEIALVCVQLSMVSFFVCLVYFTLSYIKLLDIYKLIKLEGVSKNPIMVLFSFVFYPLTHFLRRNKINEDLSVSLK